MTGKIIRDEGQKPQSKLQKLPCVENIKQKSASWGIHREVVGDLEVVQKLKSHLINLNVLGKMDGPSQKSLKIFNFFI